MKVFATLLQKRIDKESYDGIIKRQIKLGMFANCDKYFLSNMLRDMPEVGKEILEATDKWFDVVKDDVENGNGLSLLGNMFGGDIEEAMINISFDDVYGNLFKDNSNSKK